MKKMFCIVIAFCAMFSVVGFFANSSAQAAQYDTLLGQCANLGCSAAKPSPYRFTGWMEAGITVNNHGSTNDYTNGLTSPASRNLAPFSGNTYLFMSEQASDLKLNQLWLSFSRMIDTKHGFDWGFQADYLFGTDAKFTQSFGDQTFDFDWGEGDYYSSFVQLYGEVGYKNLKVKAGKYAAGMTHEALPAVASFFYSHAYVCFNTPLTVSGAVAEYTVNDRLSFSGGWVTGQMNSFENRFDDNGFLGGVTWKPSKTSSLAYHLYYGDVNGGNKMGTAALDDYNRNYMFGNETIQTLVYTRQLNPCWLYMIEGFHTDNDYNGNLMAPGIASYSTKSYGINQHLIYTITPCWAVGLRGEWQRGEGTIFDAAPYTRGGQGGDLYEITLGVNWRPTGKPNLMIRPELRYDWADYDNGFKPFANATKSTQLSGGCSAVVMF